MINAHNHAAFLNEHLVVGLNYEIEVMGTMDMDLIDLPLRTHEEVSTTTEAGHEALCSFSDIQHDYVWKPAGTCWPTEIAPWHELLVGFHNWVRRLWAEAERFVFTSFTVEGGSPDLGEMILMRNTLKKKATPA